MAKKTLDKGKVGGRNLPVADTTTTNAARPAAIQTPVARVEPVKAAVKAAPTCEEIAKRAFEIYMGRGQTPGREKEDWAQAERELRAEAARKN